MTYFDFHGGRGEPARLALFMGGIEFEDERISFDAWPALKAGLPLNAIPVLEVDGKLITQSNTINRFVGKLTNLYPTDPWQAALCDEVMDAVEDIGCQIVATFSATDEHERKILREGLAKGPIPLYLGRLQANLEDRGTGYFADGRITVADLKVFVWVRHLRSGNLDHIPTDLVDQTGPLLVKHMERISTNPKIVAYYDKD